MNRAQPPFAPLLAVLGLLLVAWLSLTQTASAVCLPQDHSDLFATSANLSTHQETDALPPKNRVWENFENSNEITPEDQLNSLQLRWKTHFSQPELASGIPVFLNADPSGFSGGSNWFAYADGNPISKSDPFGLCAERNACTGGYGTGSSRNWDPIDIDWDAASTTGHGTLDAVGLIPGFGEIADGANGLWYSAEGNKVDAGLSFAGMIPFAGWAATGGKVLRYGDEAFEIMDGVRRSKAASMAGNKSIIADIYDSSGEKFIGQQEILVENLFSPNKSVIDVNNLIDIERFASIHDATLKGLPLPPIKVTSGSNGVPASEINFNYKR